MKSATAFSMRRFLTRSVVIVAAAFLALPVLAQNADFPMSTTVPVTSGTNYDLYVVFGEHDTTGAYDNMGMEIKTIWTRAYSLQDPTGGGALPKNIFPGPSYVFKPGDLLNINLHNKLDKTAAYAAQLAEYETHLTGGNPDEIESYVPHEINVPHNADNTNLHVHGLHVDPAKDNVVFIMPGNQAEYDELAPMMKQLVPGGPADPTNWLYSYKIPDTHLPGTHWFHAHKHAATSTHVENGMAGSFVIRPVNDADAIVPGLWNDDPTKTHDRVLVLQEIANYGMQHGDGGNDGPQHLANNPTANIGAPDITINGIHQPTITLYENYVERWRFITAGANHRTTSYLWITKLNLPAALPPELETALLAIKTAADAAPYIAGKTNFPKQLSVEAHAVFPSDTYLVALDGVTISSPVRVLGNQDGIYPADDGTNTFPILLGAGNRADVLIQPWDTATGSYFLCKNFTNLAPYFEDFRAAYGNVFTNDEAGESRYKALVDSNTAITNTFQSIDQTFSKLNINSDPYNIGADWNADSAQQKFFNPFETNPAKQVTAKPLVPLIRGKVDAGHVQYDLIPSDLTYPPADGAIGWQPTKGAGQLDSQVLMKINVAPAPSGYKGVSMPQDLATRLKNLSPTTMQNPPGYVANIPDAVFAGNYEAPVFDKPGSRFSLWDGTGAQVNTVQQFTINGRQFEVNDFIGNPEATELIQEPIPSDNSDAPVLIVNNGSVADYPLQVDGKDATGKNGDMTLEEVTFQDGALYSDGVYMVNVASTPSLANMDVNDLAVSAQFKVPDLDKRRPVFILGSSTRWLGFVLNTDGTVALLYDNASYVQGAAKIKFKANTWHDAMVLYDGKGEVASLYLDGQLACQLKQKLAGTEKTVMTTNYSNGEVFKGWIKNLRVDTVSNILGFYNEGGEDWGNIVHFGSKSANGANDPGEYRLWTNPGYYVPLKVRADKSYTYDYDGQNNWPTYQTVTGLPNAKPPASQSAQEWILVNNSRIFHPFHIHISPFFVTEIGQLSFANGKWDMKVMKAKMDSATGQFQGMDFTNMDPPHEAASAWWTVGKWWDTIMIPPHGYVIMRSWINVPYQYTENNVVKVQDDSPYTGSWVYHCHILRHEDRGMMMMVDVTGKDRGFGNAVANYTLQSNGDDATGNNGAMTLKGVTFENGALHSNGVYMTDVATTPQLADLNVNNFSVKAQFRVSDMDATRPVFVLGYGTRWCGFILNKNGTVSMLHHNASYVPSMVKYHTDTWHQAEITYDGSVARLFLDGQQACVFHGDLGGTEKSVMISNYSNGSTFKGWIKNLAIGTGPNTPPAP